MKINIKYLITLIILFLIEVGIALFINDKIIRPYIGDILVIILMYTFIRSFIKKPIRFYQYIYLSLQYSFSICHEPEFYKEVVTDVWNCEEGTLIAGVSTQNRY